MLHKFCKCSQENGSELLSAGIPYHYYRFLVESSKIKGTLTLKSLISKKKRTVRLNASKKNVPAGTQNKDPIPM